VDLGVVLREVGGFLESEKAPFAVVGGLALQAYGRARYTNDVDLMVGADERDCLIEFLEKRGFVTLHRSEGFSNHLHADPALGRLDVIYVDRATRDKIVEGGRATTLGGVAVIVPKPEHLVAMKVHAIRNDRRRLFQDLADIQFLMTLPGVDRDEIRRYFEDAGLVERFYELE